MKKSSLSKTNSSIKTSHLSSSARITSHGTISVFSNVKLNNNDELDRTGITQDYHQRSKRNKRKKCSRRYVIVSVLITLLVILIVATILPLLLIKSITKIPNNTPVLRWNSIGITVARISGSPGSADNQLNAPYDIFLDYANNLYIADRGNHRIQKYLFGSSIGQTVAGNVTSGSSSDKLSYPGRVLIDLNENLYIADTGNHRIQFRCKGANSGTTVAGTGSAGNSSNELDNPYGIVLHPTSNTFYIADSANHRIISYILGNNSGTLVFGFNGGGNNNTQLYRPVGLHFDILTNSLVITNHAAHKIVRYVLGSSLSTLIAGGAYGTTPAQFANPTEATFDPMGNLYASDRTNSRIQFFYAGQLNATTIAGITRVNGTDATTLAAPYSLRLDSQLNLYVADTYNHRIQKFLRY